MKTASGAYPLAVLPAIFVAGAGLFAGKLRSHRFSVASGLARVRLRSSCKKGYLGLPDTPDSQVLGPLRSPARASPLATRDQLWVRGPSCSSIQETKSRASGTSAECSGYAR